MLKYFFEIGTDSALFDGLAISREKALCDEYRGKFPVVFITVKGVDGLNFESAYQMLRVILREEFSRLRFLKDSPRIQESDKTAFMRILNEQDTPEDIQNSLKIRRKCFTSITDRK